MVPTRDEEGNIAELVERLDRVAAALSLEIVFVDDSDDSTPATIRSVAQNSRHDIRLIHRESDRRRDGLAGAVVEGLHAARGYWACVMDADLQHPPELVADLLEQARRAQADLVIASRYSESADVVGLRKLRKHVSKSLTIVARSVFPVRLGNVTDPLSGFFLLRRDSISLSNLHPKGFKILLDILVTFPHLKTVEIPFHFGKRYTGHSKASLTEGAHFFALLCSLRFSSRLKSIEPRTPVEEK